MERIDWHSWRYGLNMISKNKNPAKAPCAIEECFVKNTNLIRSNHVFSFVFEDSLSRTGARFPRAAC